MGGPEHMYISQANRQVVNQHRLDQICRVSLRDQEFYICYPKEENMMKYTGFVWLEIAKKLRYGGNTTFTPLIRALYISSL